MNTRDLPGSLDFVQCVDGKDTIIQDYAKVDGWQNAEVMDIIAQLEQSITTREIPPVPAVNFHITDFYKRIIRWSKDINVNGI